MAKNPSTGPRIRGLSDEAGTVADGPPPAKTKSRAKLNKAFGLDVPNGIVTQDLSFERDTGADADAREGNSRLVVGYVDIAPFTNLDYDGAQVHKNSDIETEANSFPTSSSAELLLPAIEKSLKSLGHRGVDAAELAQVIAEELSREQITVLKAQTSLSISRPLPTVAPETYQGLRGPETPPAFVQRVYGEWLGHGLTRAHIRKLDAKLYEGINNWLSRPGNQWPAEVDLPTLKEQNDRDWAAMNSPENRELLGKFTGKEAARIGAAVSRRTKQ